MIGTDPSRLYISVFIGDESLGIPRDQESVAIWKRLFASKGIEAKDIVLGSEADGARLGMQGARIFYYDAKKNWWSRAGTPEEMPAGEPGGPDSEVFYDFGTPHNPKYGALCHPNCDCGRFIEIGNNVFMMYLKQEDGTFKELPKKNVDFGGGLERIAAAANGVGDVFTIDVFQHVIRELAAASGKNYGDAAYTASFRVIADHLRAAVFMLGDGVLPSNTERGYVLRRLIRRAVRHMDKLEMKENAIGRIVDGLIALYRDQYPELSASHSAILLQIAEEEARFRKTLDQGMREFEKLSQKGSVNGEDAFVLFTTYGFPWELTEEIAHERGLAVDRAEFDARMKEHQAKSRAGAAQKFAGGLADHSEQTVRYHTTHHLLLAALRQVLGPDVHQRGSNITAERLRIDFSFPRKMTDEEKTEVARIVNEKIAAKLPVTRTVMAKEEAEKLGAEHEFGVKYPSEVSVYAVGPKDATEENPKFAEAYSIEFCGGPHVTNTGDIAVNGSTFKILKEESVAAGIRRIKAVVE